MKVEIITDRKPWAAGSPAMKGDKIEVSEEEGQALLEAGFALEVKIKRARNAKGQLNAADPSPPDYNESREGGQDPKKTKAKKCAYKQNSSMRTVN